MGELALWHDPRSSTHKKMALNMRKMEFLSKFCAMCAQKYMEDKFNFSLFADSSQFFVSVRVGRAGFNPRFWRLVVFVLTDRLNSNKS
jgi:hypothetical protein